MYKNHIVRLLATKARKADPVSPLRYPGAKRWLNSYIADAIVSSGLEPSIFLEPFAGGASASLAMLARGLVQKVVLNDADPLIASFWRIVFSDPDWLIEKIQGCDVTVREWERIRRSRPTTDRNLAFKCLFLNRTSFSGILNESAGPIGGKSQKSEYKIDCRFSRNTIANRIETIAKMADDVVGVWNLPWKAAISRATRLKHLKTPRELFVYLDPPFYQQGKKLYRHYFGDKDHRALRDYVLKVHSPWLLSYDACSEVMDLYSDSNCFSANLELLYSTSASKKRSLAKEIIVSNLDRAKANFSFGERGRTTSSDAFSRDAYSRRAKG